MLRARASGLDYQDVRCRGSVSLVASMHHDPRKDLCGPVHDMIPLTDAPGDDHHDDMIYPAPLPLVLVHVACVAAIWTGVTAQTLAIYAGASAPERADIRALTGTPLPVLASSLGAPGVRVPAGRSAAG